MRAGQNIAEFMRVRGRRVVETAECLWHSVEGRFFISLPYHLPWNPGPEEVDRVLRSERAVGVRFFSTDRPGLPSGVYICRRKPYGLNSIHQKHRSLVRRGLARFEVRLVEKAELLGQGWELNRDTMLRQGRYDPEFGEESRWRGIVAAAYSSAGVEVYGAFSEGRLAAYMITCRDAGWLHILHQMSRNRDLPSNPNHALTFNVTKMAAEDPSLEGACYGVVALVRGDGVHLYKVRFGYEVVERTSVFQLHPALAPLLRNRVTLGAVRLLRRVRPDDQRFERLETVVLGARLSNGLAPEGNGDRNTLEALPQQAAAGLVSPAAGDAAQQSEM